MVLCHAENLAKSCGHVSLRGKKYVHVADSEFKDLHSPNISLSRD